MEKVEQDANNTDPAMVVTLVSPQDYFDINYHTFRTLVEKDKVDRQVIKFDRILHSTRFMWGRSTKVTSQHVTVAAAGIANGQDVEIPYDVLVLCTGCRYTHGSVDYIKGPAQAATTKERKAQLLTKAEAIEKADNYNIIGGGPSTIEMAAELLTHFPEKKVTVISKSAVMKDLNHKARAKIASFFMVHKDHVQVFEETKRSVAVKAIKTEPNQFVFTGLVPNTEFLKDNGLVQLDKDGYVVVKEGQYQVAALAADQQVAIPGQESTDTDNDDGSGGGSENVDNIFCFGDIAKPNAMEGDWKSGDKTSKLARFIYENIALYVQGEPLATKKREPGGATLSLGPQDGVGSYGKFNVPVPLVVSSKSKDMGVEKIHKLLTSS